MLFPDRDRQYAAQTTAHPARAPFVLVSAILTSAILVSTAWLSDDALITLRQVEMVASGEGIVWNEGIRVQGFTHPLWFMALTFGRVATGYLYEWALLLSALCAVSAMMIFARHCRENEAPIWMLGLPIVTVSIPEYMSSGLENPLSFLIAALIFTQAGNNQTAARDRWLWILLALATLNRLDHALQFGPLALYLFFSGRPLQQLRRAAIGIALLLCWFAFATFYFGAPLPNTFYAKLSAELTADAKEYLRHHFLLSSTLMTPVTSFLAILGVAAGLIGQSRERLLAVGIALHLGYLWYIGGDFMQGRMMALDAFIGCFLFVQRRAFFLGAGRAALLGSLVGLWGAGALHGDEAYPKTRTAVFDERSVFYPFYGLLSHMREWPMLAPPAPGLPEITQVYVGCGLIGGKRLSYPRDWQIVDVCGLVDPFLARFPAVERSEPKAGHFYRKTPLGYANMILKGRASGMTEEEKRLYETIHLITTGPLFSPKRLNAILTLQTGKFDIQTADWRDPNVAINRMEPALTGWFPPRPK